MERAKRIICMALCFAMLAGYLPAPVHAEDMSLQGLCDHHSEHIDCSYAPAVDAVECGHQHDGICYVQIESCIHTHDGCGTEEFPCEHICSEDTGCITVTLNCQHKHDNECGYADAAEAVACDYVCAECSTQEEESLCDGTLNCTADEHRDGCEKRVADDLVTEQEATQKATEEQTAMDQSAANMVQAMIDALPTLEEIQAKPLEDQMADYIQVQAAYKSYEELTESQKMLLPDSGTVFGIYFEYFNRQVNKTEIDSGTCGKNLTWTLDEKGTLTISGTGNMYDYYYYESASRSRIPWYIWRTFIKIIIIEDGVTYIGEYAFYDCSSLTNIVIPDSVTNMGAYAFSGCSSLTSIDIPKSIASIGTYAFNGCSSLTSIAIPEGIVRIGEHTFYACSNLTSIIIPKSVTSIDAYAFYDCSSLTSITIPDGVTSIGGSTFYGCSSLTSIVIPDGVSIIWDYTFSGCSSLASITIPESITRIGNHAFFYCSSLTSITIPEGVTYIEDSVFCGCSSLTSVTIPENVTIIGKSAFSGCIALKSITIPDGVTSIGNSAFSSCSTLISITIPDSVTVIGDSAYTGCQNLCFVSFPSGLSSIGYRAFYNCPNLKHVLYGGSDNSNISIDYLNAPLNNATWHCNTEGTEIQRVKNCENTGYFCSFCNDFVTTEKAESGSHVYTDSTDLTCNDCPFIQNLDGFTIWRNPTKTQYCIYKEELNTTGGILLLNYNDGAQITMDMDSDLVIGFDNTKLGYQSLNVSYCGFSQNYNVCVIPGTPDTLRIATPAVKTVYFVGEALDQTDLVLTATYEGHGTIDLPLTYASTIVPDMNSPGTKTVTLTVGDTSISYDIAVHSQCRVEADAADYPESDHNYASNTDETKIFTVPGAYQLTLTFTADTATEIESDYIYLYDGQDNQVGVYSGTQAAGKTVTIPGDTVKIRLVSDESVNKYGYAFSSIVATMTDHVFGDWTVTKEATCSQEGSRTRTCLGKDCSYSETETIPAGHTVANGICTGCKSLGTCGENLAWTLNDGVLTIFGAGNMTTYTSGEAPWYGVSSSIQSIVVEDGVTGIGSCAFQECSNLRDVILPDSITAIDLLAFSGCSSLTEIAIPAGVTNIGDLAFSGCTSLGRIVFTGNAPSFLGGFGSSPESNVFQNVTATACYPGINKTWTSDVMQNYGGTITWEADYEKFAVTLDAQGGTIYDAITEYAAGIVVQLPTTVMRSGYIFQGWYEGDTQVTEIPADASGDKVYTARWQEKATVEIDTRTQRFGYDGNGKEFVLKDADGNILPSFNSQSREDWFVPCNFAKVIAPFGERTDPMPGESTYHQGIDLAAPEGTPIYATRSGQVTTTTYGSAAGYYVRIDHLDGFSSIYMHMTHYVVSVGQNVSAGQLIGYVGQTGVAAEPHLHFGIAYNGAYVNPESYVDLNEENKFRIDYSYSGMPLNENGLPYESGEYSIRITRPETATHQAVDLWIYSAIRIIPSSGDFGYEMYWEFDKNTGTLTITGSGSMYDFSLEDPAPWSIYADNIRNLDLSNLETSISAYAFAGCHALTDVTIPKSVHGIGESAFAGCTSLMTIEFMGECMWIEDDSFSGVTATAYYPAGWYWYEDDLSDYGGKITWVETGVEAKKLTVVHPEMMAVGTTNTFSVDVRPWNAVADCTFSVSNPSVVEIESTHPRYVEIRAVGAGTTTVRVVDKKTGLSYSGKITVVESQQISIPCSMELKIPEGDSERSFSFTPETDGTYLFTFERIEEKIISDGDYGASIYIVENDNWIYSDHWNEEAQVIQTYLSSGTTYVIVIPVCRSAYDQTAVFTAEKVSDDTVENTILRFYNNQIEHVFLPGENRTYWQYADYNGTSPLSWHSSDPNILEITDVSQEYHECAYRVNGEGTAVITATDGILSASVTVTTTAIEFSELYIPITKKQDEDYFYTDYAFIAPEAGRYAFTVTADDAMPSIGFNSSSNDADIMYSYGENSAAAFRTMEAGEVCQFYVYGDASSYTVRVSKAATKPLSMKLIVTEHYAGAIRFGAAFTPGNACDRVVSWEIDNRDIASETNNPDRYSNDRNLMTYEIYDEGTLTVTAISESGFRASLTVSVQKSLCENGHTYGDWIHLQDAEGNETGRERRTCVNCGEYQERNMPPLDETVENRVIIDSNEIAGQSTVWIDGAEYALQKHGDKCYVDLPDSNARTMVTYTYNSSLQTRYPVGMKVWMLENVDGIYTVTRQQSFDDILQYSGMSIRVTGKKGIRMITGIAQSKKKALTSDGLEGFTLKEYGTAIAWASQLGSTKPLTLGRSYVKSNYAYKKGVADPVFAYSGNLMQYTNVLVNFSNEQCKDDIAMRPYMILEDENGEELTIYGGIVNRSIGYIAYQNRNVFEPRTDEYNYIWDIIHYVYGDVHDDEFIHAWTPSTK